MRLVTADRAQPGMTLAAPVMDRKGRLLIPDGVSLTERHVQALKMWGISEIEVEGDDGADEGGGVELSPEVEARIVEEVESRFGGVGWDHPFLGALREVAVERARQGASTAEAAT